MECGYPCANQMGTCFTRQEKWLSGTAGVCNLCSSANIFGAVSGNSRKGSGGAISGLRKTQHGIPRNESLGMNRGPPASVSLGTPGSSAHLWSTETSFGPSSPCGANEDMSGPTSDLDFRQLLPYLLRDL